VGEETGVATVLDDDELLSEHARVCGESDLNVRGWGGDATNDTGMPPRCAMLVPFRGMRLGRGDIFLRPGNFSDADMHCIGGTNVVGSDCGLGDRKI